jgi:hypothetical protein
VNWYARLVEERSLGKRVAGGGTVDAEDSLYPVTLHASPLRGRCFVWGERRRGGGGGAGGERGVSGRCGALDVA